MFVKVFDQIFDSSIVEDHVTRHVFMDLLVLADRNGEVDMTMEAISRRTNVPLEIVRTAMDKLASPDLTSRTPIEEGRRIVLLDDHRNWGWRIVNYERYRDIRDEEARRAYFREYKRNYRDKSVQLCPQLSTAVLDSPTLSTHTEAEAEVKPPTPFAVKDKLDPSMAVSGLMDKVRLASPRARVALEKLARLAEREGEDLYLWVDKMVEVWTLYEQSKADLRITWNAESFFGDGHYRTPDAWPRKTHAGAGVRAKTAFTTQRPE